VAFPNHICAYIGGKYEKKREKRIRILYCTVGFLRDLALFGERKEDLLRGCFGDGAFEVGGDVYGAVWAVYLMVVRMRRSMWDEEHWTAKLRTRLI
jgi:hypothetical protein